METVTTPRELRVKRGDTLAFCALEIAEDFTSPTAITFSVLDASGSLITLGSLADGRIYPVNGNTTGAYNCKIPPAVTSSLDVRIYQYRLRMTYSGGTYTVAEGNLRVED